MNKFLLNALLLILFIGCGSLQASPLQDGDLIFQTSHSSQSEAIQMATHSKYSHVGILFIKEGKPYVYEAVKTVRYTPLQKWIDRGVHGHYVVKRIKMSEKLLTPQAVNKLKTTALYFKGKPYDLEFSWSDDHIYCSELVWKIYDRAIDLQIGKLKKLSDFDLSNKAVKMKLKERYGESIPLDEPVISPGDMFTSDLLTTVITK